MTTVLTIEDETNIRLFIATNLEARGYTVLQAGTGTVGLVLMREASPDVTVLDMMLPDMQGWNVLEAMDADPILKGIPVILMTALSYTVAPTGKEYGNLVARLVKPSSAKVLVDAVQKALVKQGG